MTSMLEPLNVDSVVFCIAVLLILPCEIRIKSLPPTSTVQNVFIILQKLNDMEQPHADRRKLQQFEFAL